jgi:DNA-binding transcriptional regulator YiaG
MPEPLTPESIIELRRRLGLSQAAFASLLNSRVPGLAVNTPTVSRWENGKHQPASIPAAVIRDLIANRKGEP